MKDFFAPIDYYAPVTLHEMESDIIQNTVVRVELRLIAGIMKTPQL
jgi:hypothetical protein